MAIKFEKLSVGMTLYSRSKQKMGNTTMKTVVQHSCRVLELDPVKRQFKVTDHMGGRWLPERLLSRYFDWSMHGPLAHREESKATGQVFRVRKLTRKELAARGAENTKQAIGSLLKGDM